MVRRVRSRPHRFQRQRRRASPRALAGDRRAVSRDRGAARSPATTRFSARRPPTDARRCPFRSPGLSRGTGGLAPASSSPSDGKAITIFSISQQTPSTSPTAASRAAARPSALDAFVFTERGVYRSGETVFSPRSCATPRARRPPAADPRRQAPRRRRISARVQVDDQGARRRAPSISPLLSGVATGDWRIEAFADPKSRGRSAKPAFSSRIMFPNASTLSLTPSGRGRARGRIVADRRRWPLSLWRAGRESRSSPAMSRFSPRASHGLPALKGYEAGAAG